MEDDGQDTCFKAGSVAGAVIGTFVTTVLLLAVAALFYKQWRRHKGKHLVLVTDPEIVEDAYAFDNPCFKDATPAIGRVTERPLSTTPANSPSKDSARWSTPWTSLGLGSGNRNDKRRTLDDSCLGSKATKVSVVSLRSHDFTGLGFNVCGNMREGIFVKDLLHRGPASESGRIHPGDRITSVKISFRNMVYEDALTILSYASPYDVELEIESGGSGSKPTTLLKKTVGPGSPGRICHPLYRSQSIPELSQAHKSTAKRLFIADPNESVNSNYSTMNSTIKSSKSTPGSQTLERRHDEVKNNHHKFGIKVLPALDGTVHRVENQNEHNTNLERRHSKKMVVEKQRTTSNSASITPDANDNRKVVSEVLQQRENPLKDQTKQNKRQPSAAESNGVDVTDKGEKTTENTVIIPSEVPAEVHNAAMAARRNRKNSAELLNQKAASSEPSEQESLKSPQKNKRKAPAPPKSNTNEPTDAQMKKSTSSTKVFELERDDTIDTITDYTESLNDYVTKVRETTDSDSRRQRFETQSSNRRNSDSDTDSEVHNSFTTIELDSTDITIHRTPVPDANDDENDDDDMYRKAASLGDLSKYKSKTSTPLERAQSLDMTDTGSKKRKAPLPPEDINESTEDLTKLDQLDTFDRRKLKKSSEWGTLEDVIWGKEADTDDKKISRTRKKSNGTLERSKSAVEIKLKEEVLTSTVKSEESDDSVCESSIELFNLPLSKKLTQEFIHAERMFNPDEDNSLARIVNDGTVVKSPTVDEVELDFRQAKPLPDEEDPVNEEESEHRESIVNDDFSTALKYFELHSSKSPSSFERNNDKSSANDLSLYAGKKIVVEEPMTKVTIQRECPVCDKMAGHPQNRCDKHFNFKDHKDDITELTNKRGVSDKSESLDSRIPHSFDANKDKDEPVSSFQARRTKFESKADQCDKHSPVKTKPLDSFETHYAKRIVNVSNVPNLEGDDEEDEDEYEFGSSVMVNSKNLSSPKDSRHNVSNVSVSSGENSEDSGLVRESVDYNSRESESRPPLPCTPVPNPSQKMTYITEIKVSPSRENLHETESDNEEIVAIIDGNNEPRKLTHHEITVTSNGKPTMGKKPPVPPRRSDISKVSKEDPEKQVVYVSEYKSTTGKNSQDTNSSDVQQSDITNKKFEHWIYVGDNKEQNRWGNGSGQPQPVTNIMLSSGDEKVLHP